MAASEARQDNGVSRMGDLKEHAHSEPGDRARRRSDNAWYGTLVASSRQSIRTSSTARNKSFGRIT